MSQALTLLAAVLLGFLAGLLSFRVKTRWCRTCGETLTCATCVRRITQTQMPERRTLAHR